ncbi:MAG: AAA family ATPase [Chloroflexi bacterium]|nr:AAA family ATPase [Chloroflexota bacterium]
MADGNVEESLIGRADELASLQAALSRAQTGNANSLVIAGEPGIGKSTLITSAHVMADQMGFVSTHKACSSVPGAPPLWPWRAAISDLRDTGRSQELFKSAKPDRTGFSESQESSLEQRFQAFDAIRNFLVDASGSNPVTISIDDMQWADEATIELFLFLSRHLVDSSVMLIAGVRVTDRGERSAVDRMLDSLSAIPASEIMTPRRLNPVEIVDLAVQVSGTRPSPHVARLIYERSNGVPFFASEICKQISPNGQSLHGEMPVGIRAAVDAVLSGLQPNQASLMQAAATLGDQFTLPCLTSILERGDDDRVVVMDALAKCETAGVIRVVIDAPGTFEFAHPLLAEQVRASTPINLKSRLHLRAAELSEGVAGEASRSDVAGLAWHYSEAATIVGTEKLVEYSLLAGEEALKSSSWSDAYRHYELVRRTLGDDDDSLDLAHAWLGLATAMYTLESRWGSDLTPQQILDGLSKAFDIFLAHGETEFAAAAASHGIIGVTNAPMEGALELVERGLEVIGESSPQMSRILTRYGDVLAIDDPENRRSMDLFEQAFQIAGSRGDSAQQLKIKRLQVQILCRIGEFEAAAHEVNSAELLIKAHPTSMNAALLRFGSTISDGGRGDIDRAISMASAGISICDGLGVESALPHIPLSSIALYRADWDAVTRHVSEFERLSHSGSSPLYEMTREAWTGDSEKAMQLLLDAIERGGPNPTIYCILLKTYAQTGVETANEAAMRRALKLADQFQNTVNLGYTEKHVLTCVRAIVAAGTGDREASKKYRARLARHAGSVNLFLGGPFYDALLGDLARAEGDIEGATNHFEQALGLAIRAELPVGVCLVSERYAIHLLKLNTGDSVTRARQILADASQVAESLQLIVLHTRLVDLQSGATGASVMNAARLTNRELEVLSLISAGRSNPEIGEELFISINTVIRHVSNIFTKIGAKNRVEAAAFARDNDLPAS